MKYEKCVTVVASTRRVSTNNCTPVLLIFFLEIPNFLTSEECEHLIQKAKEAGLIFSEVALPEEQNKIDKFDSEYT